MHNDNNRNGVSLAVLSAVGMLAAVFLLNAGQGTASARTEFSENTSVSRSGDMASPVGVAGAQALRDSVPAALFPAVTETLQSNGPSEMYRTVPDLSGEGEYRLENPPHSVSAEFHTRGVRISSGKEGEWSWSLRFSGYGRGQIVEHGADARLTADGNRVEYVYSDGVTEWYVNGPLGLQQGFTFESRPLPSHEGALEVRMAVLGDVTVEVEEGGASAFLRSRAGRDTLRYGGLYAYDATGKELRTRLEAMPNALSILVDDAGAQYPITIDPFIEKGYLSGSAEDPREKFGQSISVSGNTVVVGAPSTHWESTEGAAYVFTIPEGEKTSVPGSVVLTSPRAIEGDIFGFSVAISGDTIVVGAPGEGLDEQGDRTFKGAVYVFTKQPGGWASSSVAARLTAPDAPPETWFGTSVAISGDTVVAGAPGHRYRTWEEVSSAAYVFTKPNEGWTDTSEAAKLTPPDGSMDSKFGHSVAVSGDTIVVGAYLADGDDEEEDFGAAYVFVEPNGGWTDTSDSVELMAPDGAKGREFGWSVALSGDTLVVGAPYTGEFIDHETYREEDAAEDKTPFLGSAYVFTKSESGWKDPSDPAKLTASNGIPWTQFGWSVSVSGDTVAVGAPGVRWSLSHRGAYVFTRPSEGWRSTSEQRSLLGLDSIRSFYGSSIGINRDIIVVGASDDENENGPEAGSAFLFTKPADGWDSESPLPEPAKLTAFDGPAGDRFGHAVALEGETLVVGVPGNHDTERGRASVFRRRGNDWNYFRMLTPPDGAHGGRFGSSVALSDNTFVVGAPGTLSGDDPGAAYVFVRPDDQWGREYKVTYNVKLPMPDGAADGRFGYSVAIQGDVVVVGAPGAGAAYVYTKPTSGWTLAPTPAKLTPPEGAFGGRFGHAVAIVGDSILVGAPDGDGGNKSGVIYVFTMPDAGWEDSSDSVKITISDGEAGNRLGYAISAVGDTIVVGAPGPESGDGEGAAYVFTEPDTGWSHTSDSVRLTASDGALGDLFGHAVSVSDEFIVVGAHGEQEGSGAVYAFRRPTDGWTTTSNARKLTATDGASDDAFGYAVSTNGDSLAVGLPHGYLKGTTSGAVRVYTWPGLLWVDRADAFKLRPPNAETSRIFGVAFSADGSTAVVGTVMAAGAEQSTVRTAEASVYTRRDGVWETSVHAILSLPHGDSHVPRGLTVSENGDTVVVGLSSDDPGSSSRPGAALVFTRPEGGWVPTSEAATLRAPDGNPSHAFGQMVAISGDTIVVGASGDDNEIGTRNTGSAYVFTKPAGGWVSTTEAAKLTAPVGEEGDKFGSAVSVMGDTIVVGAPNDRDLNGNPVGSAYVFTKPIGGWVSTSESAKLVAPDGWSEDWSRNEFGSSISLMDDKIVVGAPRHAGDFGAAYVFSRPEAGWASPYIVTKLTAPEFEWDIGFGKSVSMSHDTVFVGAPGTRYSDKAGEVFIFPIRTGEGAIIGEPARLSDPHGAIGDRFGGVVSASGNTVVVGAPASDDHGPDFGAVYIFNEPAEGWDFPPVPKRHTTKLVSPDSDKGDLFGVSVSAVDDAIAVGAPSLLNDNIEGVAYVFTGSSENWSSGYETVQLTPPDEDEAYAYGWSVSLTSNTIAVTAPRNYDDARQGATYVYTRPDDGWASTAEVAKLTPLPGEDVQFFGSSVAVNAGTTVVGAVGDQDEGNPGSAYLFMKPERERWRSTSHAIRLGSPDVEDSSYFGWSVAITDDTLVVGMPSEDGPGAAYLYTKPPEGWFFLSDPVKLTPPNGRPRDWFGASVAVSGDTVVIGAAYVFDDAVPGAAYVFTKPATGWESTSNAARLALPESDPATLFGLSVAVRGDIVVVGGKDGETTDAVNVAYLFARPAGGWSTDAVTPVTFSIEDPTEIGPLGVSVAIAGKTVVIGASSESDPGAVYVFEDVIDS